MQDPTAKIGKGCRIGPSVVVGPGVVIGDGALGTHACAPCPLYPSPFLSLFLTTSLPLSLSLLSLPVCADA